MQVLSKGFFGGSIMFYMLFSCVRQVFHSIKFKAFDFSLFLQMSLCIPVVYVFVKNDLSL